MYAGGPRALKGFEPTVTGRSAAALPEAADVAGVRPEQVHAIFCPRVLHIIILPCSLHDRVLLSPSCSLYCICGSICIC